MLKDRADKALIGFALLLFAWLIVGLPFLYLPTSEQHKAPRSSGATQSPSGEPRGTSQAPFFIKVLPSDDAAEKAAQDAEDREEKKAADKWLVIWTMALFLATVGLILATAVLGFFAFRQSRDTREQIGLARDEFNSTHRPKIRVKHLWLSRNIWTGNPIELNLTCVNVGVSDAVLHQIGAQAVVVARGASLPANPTMHPIIDGHIGPIRSGLNHEFMNINLGLGLTPAQMAGIQRQSDDLYCLGYVSYSDSAGRTRITGFCRRLEIPVNGPHTAETLRFRPFEDPDYDYED